MRARIFTLHHFVPDEYVVNELFAPLVSGHKLGSHPILLSDEHGDNIAGEISYCDLRGQYYVWKNLLAAYDYVGFQHYRRYFLFDQMPAGVQQPLLMQARRLYLRDPQLNEIRVDDAAFRAYRGILQGLGGPDLDALRDTFARYDLITMRPWRFHVGQQYSQAHIPEHWPILLQVLARHSRFRTRPCHLDADLNAFYGCSMYVMRAELFDDYMSFWRETMLDFSAQVKPPADPYQSRLYGFVSERVFSFFLYQLRMEQPTLRVLELPFLSGTQHP